MKFIYLLPLFILSACSSTPKLAMRLQPPPPGFDNSSVRYPEIIRAYHVGRYADPNDGLVMHEEHVVYRVEENTRWDLHPHDSAVSLPSEPPPEDAAFSPAPVNDAILAEVNSQRLATAQIMMQTRNLASALAQFQVALQQTRTNFQEAVALRASVNELRTRLDALDAARDTSPSINTNTPPDPLAP